MKNALKTRRTISRRRRRQRRINHIVGFVALAVFVSVAISLWIATRPTMIGIAVDQNDAANVKAVETIAAFMAKEKRPIRLRVTKTDNRRQSIEHLKNGSVDLAVSRSDDLTADVQAALVIRKDVLLLWTSRKDDSDDNVRLSANTKIALFDSDQATKALALGALETLSDRPDTLQIIVHRPDDLEEVLQGDRTVTYFAALVSLGSDFAAKAISATKSIRGHVHLTTIDQSEAIVQHQPLYEAVELPKGAIAKSPPIPSEAKSSIAISQLVVALKSLPEQTGAAFARQIFTDRHDLLSAMKGLAVIEKPNTDKDAPIPVHAGVAAYIDGTERTFVERYSDLFWGLILVLSGLGTAGAWLRNLYYRDESDAQLHFRAQVTAKTKEALDATSVDQLDQIDNEIRAIVIETLNAYEAGAIDEAALTAFELVHADFGYVMTSRRLSFVNAMRL